MSEIIELFLKNQAKCAYRAETSVMGRPSLSESITEFRKGRVPDLLDNLSDGLLDNSVQNGWDSK